jgi:hypothetical protein
MDVLAAAQTLAGECDDPALTNQVSPVGLFAAAAEMDSAWRACAEGGVTFDDDDDSSGFIDKDRT